MRQPTLIFHRGLSLSLLALALVSSAVARAEEPATDWMIACAERLERLGLPGSETRVSVLETEAGEPRGDGERGIPPPLAFRTTQGFFLIARGRIAGYRVAPPRRSDVGRAPASAAAEPMPAFAEFGSGRRRAFYRVPEPLGVTSAWRTPAPAGAVLLPDPGLTARGPRVLGAHLRRLLDSLPLAQARAGEALLRNSYTDGPASTDAVPNPLRPEKMVASASATAFQSQLIRLVSTVSGGDESAEAAVPEAVTGGEDPEDFRRAAKACLARPGGPATTRRQLERALAALPL